VPEANGGLHVPNPQGAWSADCRIVSSLVVVVSELVDRSVGPLELAKGEGGRHEQVQEERTEGAPLPVAPIGDEGAGVHDAEAPPLREAPHQLYVVELQGRVEAAALLEQLASQGDAVSGSGGEGTFGGP